MILLSSAPPALKTVAGIEPAPFQILSLVPLPIGLHGEIWCAGLDLNQHCPPSEGGASCPLGYRRKKPDPREACRLSWRQEIEWTAFQAKAVLLEGKAHDRGPCSKSRIHDVKERKSGLKGDGRASATEGCSCR